MINLRVRYSNKEELQQLIDVVKGEFDILDLIEESKSKNPKYANSKYKLAYIDVQKKYK